mgnify:CR=1 FL=1
MPGFDQTGPQGRGPMTGRVMGPCGRGMGCGRGFGYGRFAGRTYLSQKEEVEGLEDEAKDMESDLKALRERIAEIKGQ